MHVLEAIKNRRSRTHVQENPVSETDIHKLIEAACWAPCHHRTSPWRFVVFEGEGRKILAQAMADGVLASLGNAPEAQEKSEKIYRKAFRAPTIIAVWCAVGRGTHKNPPAWEDYAATAAATQNLLLAAEALGLSAIWRSGEATTYPAVLQAVGADAAQDDKVMGFVYIGYPAEGADEPLRPAPKAEQYCTFMRG